MQRSRIKGRPVLRDSTDPTNYIYKSERSVTGKIGISDSHRLSPPFVSIPRESTHDLTHSSVSTKPQERGSGTSQLSLPISTCVIEFMFRARYHPPSLLLCQYRLTIFSHQPPYFMS